MANIKKDFALKLIAKKRDNKRDGIKKRKKNQKERIEIRVKCSIFLYVIAAITC